MAEYRDSDDFSSLFLVEEPAESYRSVDQLRVYQLAMECGSLVWGIVLKWDPLARDTIGKQWIRAVDSVAANLAEGYGRYSYKENLRFCHYARGSLYESKSWMDKAASRSLMSEDTVLELRRITDKLIGLLNGYIRYIRNESMK